MLPYVHILLSDLKTWFFCQLYMFCGRGGVASEKVLREHWIFYTARRRRKNSEVFGVKMMPYIHILVFFWDQNVAIYTHLFFFCGQNAARYTHFRRLLVKMLPYIYILVFFGGKMLQYIDICVVFWVQNATIYTHFGFFGRQNAAIHILLFFLVKMLQHIHICVCFWDQNATIYTHFGFFLGQNAAIYTHFWNLIFSEKTKKKKNNKKQ